jgi:hypothetical protein
MKRLLALSAAAAVLGFAAAPASAQDVTGTLTMTGSVAGNCAVVAGGTSATTFAKTVDLGELADPVTGKLKASLANTTAGAGTSAAFEQVQVFCNTGTPRVTWTATPLTFTGATLNSNGETGFVNYTAEIDVITTASTVTYTHTSDSALQNPGALSNPIANVSNNLTVQAWGLNTNGDFLEASPNYSGAITVTVSPS